MSIRLGKTEVSNYITTVKANFSTVDDFKTVFDSIVLENDIMYNVPGSIGNIVGILSQLGASERYVYVKSLTTNEIINCTLDSWVPYNIGDIVVLSPYDNLGNNYMSRSSSFGDAIYGYSLKYSTGVEGVGEVQELLFNDITTISELALALEVGSYSVESYCTVGKVLNITTAYTEANGYVSFNISDNTTTVGVYRATGEEAANIAAGDYVVIYGQLQNYNSTAQISKPVIKIRIAAETANSGYELLDVDQTIEIFGNLQSGDLTSNEYYITGEVYSIPTSYNPNYNNMTLTLKSESLGTDPVKCYRLSGEKGANINIGDVITVKGFIQNYNGNCQLPAGSTILTITPGKNTFLRKVIDRTLTEIKENDLAGSTEIGNYAFYNLSSLTSVSIPYSITSIGRYAFDDCSSLANVIIPDSVTYIGSSAFGDCLSLNSVTIPNSITRIEFYVFQNCTSLASVIIPDSITYIGNWAFYNCSSLANVTIPNSVTYIGNYAFSDCTSLKKINYQGTMEEWNSISLQSDWNSGSSITSIICSDGTITL